MNNKRTIGLAFFLTVPVILFVLHHYFIHTPDLKPTGFTNEENVLYMSYAEQYLDQDKISLTYSNPFDASSSSPQIYFQPATLFFAFLLRLGIDPGLCFSFFHLLMTFLCILVGIRIIQHLLPERKESNLISTLFTWGGGLTALGGLILSSISDSYQTINWIDAIYIADPANGWWGLNWGRSLFIPLEAFYHFLFLLNIYFILKQKWIWAVAIGLLLSISHPFTGIEYLLIINGWTLLEKLVFRNRNIPWWFVMTNILLTGLHLGYYLFYLNRFPEHRQLFEQYSTGWTYSLLIAIPAYCIVAAFSLLQVVRKNFLALPHQRLFLCWAIIAFLLSKHEWFIKPMQPIHFTRGYVWAGLFLFSLPALLWFIQYLKERKLKWVLYTAIILFLSDNLLWVGNLLRGNNNTEWEGHISQPTRELLSYLNKNTTKDDIVVGNAALANYLLHAYSNATAWVSHPYNTPHRDERMKEMNQFLGYGVIPDQWRKHRILILLDKRKPLAAIEATISAKKIWENEYYQLFTP